MKQILAWLILGCVMAPHPLWAEAAKPPADFSTVVENAGTRTFPEKPTVAKRQTEEEEWFAKGYQASLAARYDEAIEYYKKALGKKPDFAAAHANLGVTYMDMGKLNEARASLMKALTLDPENAGTHYNLGLVNNKMGKMDEAIAAYEKSIALNPKFARSYQNLGIAYLDKDLKSMAAECFYKAALLFDEQGETRRALSAYDALVLTNSPELEKALAEKLFPEQYQQKSGLPDPIAEK